MSKLLRQEGQNLLVTQGKLTINDIVSGPLQFNVQGDSYLNGNVGISNNDPQALLHVGGYSSDNSVLVSASPTSASRLIFNDAAGTQHTGGFRYAHSNDSLAVVVNASDVAKWDSAGNMGIGTDPISVSRLIVDDATAAEIAVQSGDNDSSIRFINSAGQWIAGSFSNAGGDSFRLRDSTASQNRLVIDPNGNVGVNNDSPNAKLHVSDNAAAPFLVTRDQQVSGANGMLLRQPNSTDGNSLRLAYQSNTTGVGATDNIDFASIELVSATHDHATRLGEMKFFTAQGSSGLVERARINTSGRMLVGKTTDTGVLATGHQFNPDGIAVHSRDSGVALQVNRNTSDGAIVEYYKDTALVGHIAAEAGNLELQSVSDLRFDAGAGTGKMHLESDGDLVLKTASAQFMGDTGTASAPLYSWEINPNTGMYRAAANSIGFSSAGTLRLTVDNSGVAVQSGALYLQDGSAGSPSLTFISDQNMGIYRVSEDNLGISTAGTERLLIDQLGNVGIGVTASPDFRLDVENTGGTLAVFQANGTDQEARIRLSGTFGTSQSANAEIGTIQGSSADRSQLAFYTRNGSILERMRIDEDGLVGIGVNPLAKLDVNGNVFIRGTDAGLVIDSPASNEMRIGTNGASDFLTFATAVTSEAMRIDTLGNVGIGGGSTTSAKLASFSSAASTTDVLDLLNTNAASSAAGLQIRSIQGSSLEAGKIVFGRDSDYSSAANADSNFQIFTSLNGSNTERMRINSAGSVLMGTTSAFSSSLLTVNGNIGIDQAGIFRSPGNGILQISADPQNAYGSSYITWDIDGQEEMRLSPSGLVVNDDITNSGFDFKLGSGDQITRGDTGNSRALVKETSSRLFINYANDFSGGTVVNSDLNVTGDLTVDGTVNGKSAFAGDCAVRRKNTSLSVPDQTFTTVNLDTTAYDTSTGNAMTGTANVLEVPTGVTLIRLVASFQLDPSTPLDSIQARFLKNGSPLNGVNDPQLDISGTSGGEFQLVSHPLQVVAGDDFTFQVYQDNVGSNSHSANRLSMSMEVIK